MGDIGSAASAAAVKIYQTIGRLFDVLVEGYDHRKRAGVGGSGQPGPSATTKITPIQALQRALQTGTLIGSRASTGAWNDSLESQTRSTDLLHGCASTRQLLFSTLAASLERTGS